MDPSTTGRRSGRGLAQHTATSGGWRTTAITAEEARQATGQR